MKHQIFRAVSDPAVNVKNRCDICGKVIACKPASRTQHGRWHVRRGEATEMPGDGLKVNGRVSREPCFYVTVHNRPLGE